MRIPAILLLPIVFIPFQTANSQQWKQQADSARYYVEQKNNAGALPFFMSAQELLQKDSVNSMSFFRVSNELADCYVATGQYAKAAPHYNAAKSVVEKLKGKENAEYALICNNLGRLQRLMGQYEQSEKSLIEAKYLREKLFGKENADYATSCNLLAILYAEVGQYNDAGPLYIEAKDIRERVLGKDHIDYAASCNNVGIYYVLTGKPAEAEPFYLEAKRIREKALGKEHPFYAASCNNLAALYMDLGQYDKAEPLYLEAKSIRERTLGTQHPDYAASCDNMAILYMDLGYYETAEALYMEARQVREKMLGTKHIEYAKGCNNLALLYKILGQYEKSAALFAEAKSIFFDAVGKDHFEYGKCCNNLGAVYMDMGDYKKADSLYREAKEVWEKVLGKEHPEYAKACHNLGLVYFNRFQYDKAEALLLEANSIREKTLGKDHVDYAEGCDNLASVYAAKNDLVKAVALASQAKQIREKIVGVAHPDYLQSCINLANIYNSSGDYDMAVNLYTEAFSSQQALLQKIFRFTTEPEKQAYLRKVNEYRNYFLSFINSVAFDRGAVYAYQVSLANKNLLLNSSQRLRQVIANTGDTSLLATYANWIRMREQLAFWYAKPVQDRKIQVQQLEEQANQLERQLVNASETFQHEQLDINWKTVQQSLQPGQAAIEFSNYHPITMGKIADSTQYFAVIIRRDRTAPELVRLFEKRQLDQVLGNRTTTPGQLRINYLYKYRSTANAKSPSLYNLAWQPLEEKLSGINTIFFSPAGELHKLSFAALPVNATQLLGDKYQLIQLSSTAAITEQKNLPLPADSRINLYGGVLYDADSVTMRREAIRYKTENSLATRSAHEEVILPGINEFSYLVQSEKEVNEIAKLAKQKGYQVSLANGVAATEESVKVLPAIKQPGVLHIATHGFFFPDRLQAPGILHVPTHGYFSPDIKPGVSSSLSVGAAVFQQSENPLIRSGLALAGANNAWKGKPVPGVEDGILTAYEVSNLYMPDIKLAVLSACETGLGEIQGSEGVYGLQRAFKIAGVEQLVMSLWKVPDLETSEFMQEFYKNLFASQPIPLAFQNVQKMMKAKYRNEPFKWAAWVLVR